MSTWQERAESVLAQGCLTYSKSAQCYAPGFPTHLISGSGCHVTDADGKAYVDFCGGLGSNLLDCQNNLSLPTIYEVQLAEAIRERIPICEKLRLLKTGSEACQAAVRIARAYKGVKPSGIYLSGAIVWGTGYHGHHSVFISAEKPGAGCFYEYYNKFDELSQILSEIKKGSQIPPCAIIVEPVQLDASHGHKMLLKDLRDLCTKHGIVLIFDEVITGFRTPGYCMANYFGIQPDIICMGKALGNGYPMAVVGGRREIMDTPGWFVSSTFAGEMTAIKQALNVIDFLTPERLQELWERGAKFQRRFNAISPKIQLKGIPTKAVFVGDDLFKNLFWQEMCKRGVLMFKAWHITFAHTQPVMDFVLMNCEDVIKEIESGNVQLEGKPATEVFKRH